MRLASLLTNSTTLLVLQQIVSLWFLVDFFLARDSTTANRLLNKHLSTTTSPSQVIQRIEALTNDLKLKTCNASANYQEPTFDKVVLVVIDAFGAEFLPSFKTHHDQPKARQKMPFLERALEQHKAMGFVATAATPTVTMPRIKALVSGTIPSFTDLIYNLASDVSDFHEDNILRLARARNKSLVFYGDDTWLSLFDRSMFKRSRATLSLFASDYTSVDTNVTEMALPESKLDPLDWDYLILHYLGLDHIGHVFGSNEAPLIEQKLIEMDNVLSEMYSDLSKKSDKTLMIVCGDHGMSEQGNHGGDTKLETETAMIFLPINRQLARDASKETVAARILQVDLAATLSTLTGLPIPQMSRGVVVEQLLSALWNGGATIDRSACAVADNLAQLSRLLDDDALNSPAGLASRLLELLEQSTSFEGRRRLSASRVGQLYQLARDIQGHLLQAVAAKSNPLLVMLAVSLVALLSLKNLHRASHRLLMPLMASSERLICLISLALPILMLGSTDYLESEHTWWLLFSALLVPCVCLNALFLHSKHSLTLKLEPFRVVLLIVSFAIVATRGASACKFIHDADSWAMPLISLLIMCNHSRSTSDLDRRPSLIIFWTLGACVFVTKMLEEVAEKQPDHIGRVAAMQLLALALLSGATLANLYIAFQRGAAQPASLVQKLAISWMWFVFMLSRSRQYPFLIANVMLEASLNNVANSLKLCPISRATLYLCLASFAFYAQGNSNLFSSLDVKPGFFAQTSYHLWLAVPLIACATCASQIFWYLKLFQRVQGAKEQEQMAQAIAIGRRGPLITPRGARRSAGDDHSDEQLELIPEGTKEAIKDLVDMRNFLTLAYFIFVCLVLRNHLFIWSVVSPKLVYLYVTNTILRLTTATISALPRLLASAAGATSAHHAYKTLVS